MTTIKTGGLGRGLKALLPASDKEGQLLAAGETGEGGRDYFSCPIEFIKPNPYQPRTTFNEEELTGLAKSIREKGVLQPLVVRRTSDNRYELIAGERRLRAARLAELEKVPVIVKDIAISDRLELALIENIQRSDLNPLEEAEAYAKLMDEFGLTQDCVAKRVGKSRSAIANSVRVLQLPDPMKESLAGGEISAGHARVLLGIEDEGARKDLFERIVANHLSVREAEAAAKKLKAAPAGRKRPAPILSKEQCREHGRRIAGCLGVKSKVVQRGRKGAIEIEFTSKEELERIVALLTTIKQETGL